MDINAKVMACLNEIEFKKELGNDTTADKNNLKYLLKGLKKQIKEMNAELTWQANICASVEKQSAKYERYLPKESMVIANGST